VRNAHFVWLMAACTFGSGCLVRSTGSDGNQQADPAVVKRLMQYGGLQAGYAIAITNQVSSGLQANASRGGSDYDRTRQAVGYVLFGASGPGATPQEYQQRHSQVMLRLYRGLDAELLPALFAAPDAIGFCVSEFKLAETECAALRAAATQTSLATSSGPLVAARTAFGSGDYAQAAMLYQQAAEQAPSDPVPLAGLGRARMKLGDGPGAAQALQAALQLVPNSQELMALLAEAQRMGAAATPSATAGAAPAQPQAAPATQAAPDLMRQGDTYFERKSYLSAAATYERAAQQMPNDPQVHLKVGKSYLALSQPGRAIPAFERALAIAPYNVDLNLQLANALRAARKFDEARARYKNVLNLEPGNPTAKAALARMDRAKPKAKPAAKSKTRIVSKRPLPPDQALAPETKAEPSATPDSEAQAPPAKPAESPAAKPQQPKAAAPEAQPEQPPPGEGVISDILDNPLGD